MLKCFQFPSQFALAHPWAEGSATKRSHQRGIKTLKGTSLPPPLLKMMANTTPPPQSLFPYWMSFPGNEISTSWEKHNSIVLDTGHTYVENLASFQVASAKWSDKKWVIWKLQYANIRKLGFLARLSTKGLQEATSHQLRSLAPPGSYGRGEQPSQVQ